MQHHCYVKEFLGSFGILVSYFGKYYMIIFICRIKIGVLSYCFDFDREQRLWNLRGVSKKLDTSFLSGMGLKGSFNGIRDPKVSHCTGDIPFTIPPKWINYQKIILAKHSLNNLLRWNIGNIYQLYAFISSREATLKIVWIESTTRSALTNNAVKIGQKEKDQVLYRNRTSLSLFNRWFKKSRS